MGGSAKYWVSIGYPENMVPDWQTRIGDLLELPYCYCIHDKDHLELPEDYEIDDLDHDERKIHVHIIIVFPNTTTYKHALNCFRKLNRPGCNAFNTCKQIINIRNKYDYLIHDTETCRKIGKHLYDKSERIEGNNFDIGAYEQIGLEEKEKIRRDLSKLCISNGFITYSAFYSHVLENFDTVYESIIVNYQGHFDKLCKGNFHRMEMINKMNERMENRENKKEVKKDE